MPHISHDWSPRTYRCNGCDIRHGAIDADMPCLVSRLVADTPVETVARKIDWFALNRSCVSAEVDEEGLVEF